MKQQIFLLFLLPAILLAHVKDERLFKTAGIPSSALLLMDRSGSMRELTERYYVQVRLNDYSPSDFRDRLIGWYDDEIIPDGPGTMSSFSGEQADSLWILRLEWYDLRLSTVIGNWTLKIMSNGVWYTFEGGSFSWSGWWYQMHADTINVRGLGTVDDVECYVNIATGLGLDIGRMRVNLIHTPGLTTSTRIKDAILVIHSLLDANKDGLVDESDNEELPIYLGQGFHREDVAYLPNSSRYSDSLGQSYNEYEKKWEDAGSGELYTDSIGSNFQDIWSHINYTDIGGYTPNGLLIARAIEYINNWRNMHPDLWCIKHNFILLTDGETNEPIECDSGSMDVVRQAYKAWHNDSIKVYAVGFGTDIKEKGANELNWIAKWGGTQKEDSNFIDSMVSIEGMDTSIVDPRDGCPVEDPKRHFLTGYAYIAESLEELSSALSRIFMQIVGQINLSFSEVEVASLREEFISTQYQSRFYLSLFNPNSSPIWDGDLKAVRLTKGKFNIDSIPSGLIIWSAQDSFEVDMTADERNIFGIKSNGNMLPFNKANFDTADLNVTSSSKVEEIIERVRDGIEDDNRGELGDIFHSSPLRIHLPNYFYVDQGYNKFYMEMRERSPLVYAGANDAMIHVFADSIKGEAGRGGEEIAGIIPANFLPKLQNLLIKHDYFVDADPVAADVWFPESEYDSVKQWDEWHTVLIACQGEGGRSFTALDVTDPLGETMHPMSSVQFLFNAMQSSILHDTIGYTLSTPIIHKVGVNWSGRVGRTVDRFYAFMGGGMWPDPMDISVLDSILSGGRVLGNVIIAFDIWKAKEGGLDGNVHLINPTGRDASKMVAPFPSAPSIINMNPEVGNRFDFLFIPDALGQLWMVDLRSPDPYYWEAECIFTPELPTSSDSSELYSWHPVFYRPLVWKDPVFGDYWIAYGTGNRSDVFSPSNERFYALKYPEEAIEDTNITIPVYVEGDLGTPSNPSDAGWMYELEHPNEKVVTPAIYYMDSLKFSTFSPGADADISPCGICETGQSRSYTFNIRTGGVDVIGGIVTGTDIPQPPRYSFALDGSGLVISQSAAKLEIGETRKFKSFREIIKWKED
jgi:hypothetical protein